MSPPLNSGNLRRLDTWAGAIAQVLRPDAPVAHTADGLRLGQKSSLSITAADGWYDHEAGKGGRDALSLIRHLRGGSAEAAVLGARGWLEQHLGDGDLHVEVAEAHAAEASGRRTAWALQALDEATDPLATPAETFPGAPTVGLIDAHLGASWAELKGSAPSQQSAEPRR